MTSVVGERKSAQWKRALCALGAVDVVFSVGYLHVLYQARVCVSEKLFFRLFERVFLW